MTNAQLINRIASLNAHQMHIESLETLLQNSIDRQAKENRIDASAHRLRIESCLRVEREIQDQELLVFRNEMQS